MDEDKIDAEEIFCDDPAALAALKSFGIKYLYPWQRLVIANIMDASENPDEKTNQIVLLPTGAGKSLCFQIPAMLLNGPTLVIYPLLALMNDQYRRMKEGGLNAVIFKGGQTATEWEENFLQLKKGAKIIIANPEILMDGSACRGDAPSRRRGTCARHGWARGRPWRRSGYRVRG